MFIYQFIDVEDQELISEKLYDYLKNHTEVFSRQWFWNFLDKDDLLSKVPELEREIKKIIPLAITFAACVFKRPDHVGDTHIDSNRAQRLLWPVKNCQGSYTRFYDLNGNLVNTLYGPNGNPYLKIEKIFNMPEIAAVELTRPVIFDSAIPHNVFVNPEINEPRITVTIGFSDKNLERFLRV